MRCKGLMGRQLEMNISVADYLRELADKMDRSEILVTGYTRCLGLADTTMPEDAWETFKDSGVRREYLEYIRPDKCENVSAGKVMWDLPWPAEIS